MGLRMARRPIRATHDATAYDPVALATLFVRNRRSNMHT